MLTKTALLILGIIADEPINPYAISKLISFKRKNLRGTIPDSTVYGIISMLHKKKLITGKRVRNRNTPDRTVYSITPKGMELLKKSLTDYLGTPEDTLSELPLSLFLMSILDKSQVVEALTRYQTQLNKEISLMEDMVKAEKERKVPYTGQIAIEHILRVLKLNLDTVTSAIHQIESDNDWSRPRIPFWRAEFNQKKNPGG